MPVLINEIFQRNKILAFMGLGFLLLAMVLAIYSVFNPVEILGINAIIKPIKFCLSTWIYAWTMAYILDFVHNKKSVKWYSILAAVVMIFENGVIIIQAFRGQLSHFNTTSITGGILYALMGVMIVWLTSATLIIAIRMILQRQNNISGPFALSIKIGLIMFVIFSFLGGYMSAINSHNIGGEMGKDGLPFVNWSTMFGDIRVAHFFGIHSLQLIPFIGYLVSLKIKEEKNAKTIIWFFAGAYFAFICFTVIQALNGEPFLRMG